MKKPSKTSWKRKLLNVLLALMFLAGFLILAYPTISDQWNTYRQSRLISSYEDVISEMEPEDFTAEWEKARNFNSTLTENSIYGDVFGEDDAALEDTEYWQVLNVAGDGVMGYLSIPKINVKLSIYHGTGDDVLQTGVGHLNGTKLPIGGESTHSVLAAHRGLPSARLFTDIDQMEKGDMFYIHVLDEVLAYQVDEIHDMVDKDDMAALEDAMKIHEDRRRRRLRYPVHMYALWREFSQTSRAGHKGALQRGGRGDVRRGVHGTGGSELLYAVPDSGTCGYAACDPGSPGGYEAEGQ